MEIDDFYLIALSYSEDVPIPELILCAYMQGYKCYLSSEKYFRYFLKYHGIQLKLTTAERRL